MLETKWEDLYQIAVLETNMSKMAALEVVRKQSRMIGHDLIAVLQVLARNHDEVRVLCKQCGEGLASPRLTASPKSATTLRTNCSPDCS
jgi:hypothetical protein